MPRTHLRLSIAALCLGLAVAACATPVPPRTVPHAAALTPEHVDAYREALALRSAGRTDEALDALAPFLTDEPWHVPTHTLRQDLLIELGRIEEARSWYADAAREAPASAARALLAARLAPGDDEREAEYVRVLAAHPRDLWANLAVAVAALRRAEQIEARATALEDMGRAPEGEKLRIEGEDAVQTALRTARFAAQLDPALAEAHGVVSDALLAQRLRSPGAPTDEAVAAARRATEADPWEQRQFVRLARALYAARDTAGAVAALERAAELAPGDPGVLARLGRARLDLGDHVGARAALERAAPALPGDADAWHDLGVARAGGGDADGAADAFRRALEIDPDEPRTWGALARALEVTARNAAAADAMDQYLLHGGRDIESARAFIERMRRMPYAPPQ